MGTVYIYVEDSQITQQILYFWNIFGFGHPILRIEFLLHFCLNFLFILQYLLILRRIIFSHLSIFIKIKLHRFIYFIKSGIDAVSIEFKFFEFLL